MKRNLKPYEELKNNGKGNYTKFKRPTHLQLGFVTPLFKMWFKRQIYKIVIIRLLTGTQYIKMSFVTSAV